MEITAAYPAGIIGDTKENLEAAADGEKMEWSEIYADFEKTARKEGFTEIATSFKEIAEVEEFHEGRYRKLAKNIAAGEAIERIRTQSGKSFDPRVCEALSQAVEH